MVGSSYSKKELRISHISYFKMKVKNSLYVFNTYFPRIVL